MHRPLVVAVALLLGCGPENFHLVFPVDASSLDLRFEGSHAYLRGTLVLENDSPEFEDRTVEISLPQDAVVTGLRATSNGAWTEASLMDAESAEAVFDGSEPVPGRHPAVLL
jgi:hypothetical protein